MASLLVKIVKDIKSENNTLDKVIAAYEECLKTGYGSMDVVPQLVDDLSSYLREGYLVDIRDGVSGGCYGARTGEIIEGISVYTHLSEFKDGPDNVNFFNRLEECGQLLDGSINGSVVTALCGGDIGNTFNNDYGVLEVLSHCCYAKIGDGVYAVSYHLGGDIRGNYSDYHVYEMDEDAFYGALFPYKESL